MLDLAKEDGRALAVNVLTAVFAVKLLRDDPRERWDDGAALLAAGAALGVLVWGWKHGG